ncbi:MAG: hypothetical protein ACOYN4_14645, partial [Bacteroidales bacterium]
MEATIQSQIISSPTEALLCINHKAFIVYVRTLQFLKTRLKGIDENESVHIPQKEIAERFFPYPKWECKNELQRLVEAGELSITETINTKTGHKMFLYETLQPGLVDLYLVKSKFTDYDPDTLQMIGYLMRVSVAQHTPELPPYFVSFLDFRHDCMPLFFSSDEFSGRVHTPVTSLKSTIREYLLIDGQPTIGIDVATMQPLLLGKALMQAIGPNDYSTWIDSGQDIYLILQQKARLLTRKDAKSYFFKITFGWPNNNLANLFGNTNWITWINDYKSRIEPRNTHNKGKLHNNLAWLLQSTEVALMRNVWHGLNSANIPFLTVHDEVIVKQSDQQRALSIFSSLLALEFTFFKLNCTGLSLAIPDPQVSLSPLSQSPLQMPPIEPVVIPPTEPPEMPRNYKHAY